MRVKQKFWYLKEMKECKISVNGKILEYVKEVIYLRSMFGRNRRYEMDAERGWNEG